MTVPVTSLDDFFPTYLQLLQAGDAAGLAQLYTSDAILTSGGSPKGDSWNIGSTQIEAMFAATFGEIAVISEQAPTSDYDIRGSQAARFGTFTSIIENKQTKQQAHLTTRSTEVFALSATAGWQYVADHTWILEITMPSSGA